MDTLEIANGKMMWGLAMLTVGIVILQTVLFCKRTLKYNKENQILSKEELKSVVKTGGIVSIGPALSVFVLALSMIAMLGAPVTLMRIGIIGSASTEMMAANIGTEITGVTLGKDALTPEAFTTALFSMAFMSMGYLLFVPFLTRGMGEKVMNVIMPTEDNKHKKLSTFFSMIFPIIVYALLMLAQVWGSVPNTATLLFAVFVKLLLDGIGKKWELKWMGEWSMGITVLLSMVFGTGFQTIIGG